MFLGALFHDHDAVTDLTNPIFASRRPIVPNDNQRNLYEDVSGTRFQLAGME